LKWIAIRLGLHCKNHRGFSVIEWVGSEHLVRSEAHPRLGRSSGFAFAACGRFDMYVHHFLFPWDAAAGILLVREGGGLVLDRDGGPMTLYSDSVIAGAPGAVQDFLRIARGKEWR